MAITRAQQAKQLLALGGRIGLQGGGRSSGKDPGPETGRAGRDDREIGARESRTRAAAAANQKALAALGDPDPEIDIPTAKRQDTITNYTKNLKAAFRSNPVLGLSFPTALATAINVARKTGKARTMLGLENPGPPSDDDDDEGGVNQILPVDTTFAKAPVEEEEDY